MSELSQLKAKLVHPYGASPFVSYHRLVDAITVLHPSRKSYVNERMLNEVRSVSIRREKE
jgi:hypothetical protein